MRRRSALSPVSFQMPQLRLIGPDRCGAARLLNQLGSPFLWESQKTPIRFRFPINARSRCHLSGEAIAVALASGRVPAGGGTFRWVHGATPPDTAPCCPLTVSPHAVTRGLFQLIFSSC